jgi:hypothetical protein
VVDGGKQMNRQRGNFFRIFLPVAKSVDLGNSRRSRMKFS